MADVRLDAYLVREGFVTGRDKAKELIADGKVYIDGRKAEKPSVTVGDGASVELRGESEAMKYAGRGGLKLEKALSVFGINIHGAVCMDIGASTGGFTDCMLQNGAEKVYAVDSGHGQLIDRLRNDEKVIVMERTNIRDVTPDQVEPLDFAAADVSFISLTLILPVAFNLIKDGSSMVCLIKPQFEAGRENVGKNGVVKDIKARIKAARKVCDFASGSGWSVQGFDYSPIRGGSGNIEFLVYIKKSQEPNTISREQIDAVVRASHTIL